MPATWLTSSPFREHHLRPAAALPQHPRVHAEILTYVREGAVVCGAGGVVRAGELHRGTTTGRRHHDRNASRGEAAHVVRLWLPARTALPARADEQRRFGAGERRGALRIVASPDGRAGSLRLEHDALVHSATLHAGHHLVHALGAHRQARLLVLHGSVTAGDVVLARGDELVVTVDHAISFTALGDAEVVLVDLPGAAGAGSG